MDCKLQMCSKRLPGLPLWIYKQRNYARYQRVQSALLSSTRTMLCHPQAEHTLKSAGQDNSRQSQNRRTLCTWPSDHLLWFWPKEKNNFIVALKCPYSQNFYFLIWFCISPNELLRKKKLIWIKCNLFRSFRNVQICRHFGSPFAPVFPSFWMSCDVD